MKELKIILGVFHKGLEYASVPVACSFAVGACIKASIYNMFWIMMFIILCGCIASIVKYKNSIKE